MKSISLLPLLLSVLELIRKMCALSSTQPYPKVQRTIAKSVDVLVVMGAQLIASCTILMLIGSDQSFSLYPTLRTQLAERMKICMLSIKYQNSVRNLTYVEGKSCLTIWVKTLARRNAIICAITAGKGLKWQKSTSQSMLDLLLQWLKEL